MTAAAAVIAVGIVLAGGALVGARRFLAVEPDTNAMGTLTIATNPVGAEAIVDGVRRGATPVTIALTVGPPLAMILVPWLVRRRARRFSPPIGEQVTS